MSRRVVAILVALSAVKESVPKGKKSIDIPAAPCYIMGTEDAMKAKDRAEAIREYRHYRAMLESKRLNRNEKENVRARANALAARYNLTTRRV